MAQPWVPRVFNVFLAVFFLAFLVPIFLHLGDVSTSVAVMLVVVAVLFLPMTIACLMSAAQPGSVGRAARRMRRRE
jgi:threonine/homoserine/homoserine lactone efflux protein